MSDETRDLLRATGAGFFVRGAKPPVGPGRARHRSAPSATDETRIEHREDFVLAHAVPNRRESPRRFRMEQPTRLESLRLRAVDTRTRTKHYPCFIRVQSVARSPCCCSVENLACLVWEASLTPITCDDGDRYRPRRALPQEVFYRAPVALSRRASDRCYDACSGVKCSSGRTMLLICRPNLSPTLTASPSASVRLPTISCRSSSHVLSNLTIDPGPSSMIS